jgi:hypothetical protein
MQRQRPQILADQPPLQELDFFGRLRDLAPPSATAFVDVVDLVPGRSRRNEHDQLMLGERRPFEQPL